MYLDVQNDTSLIVSLFLLTYTSHVNPQIPRSAYTLPNPSACIQVFKYECTQNSLTNNIPTQENSGVETTCQN